MFWRYLKWLKSKEAKIDQSNCVCLLFLFMEASSSCKSVYTVHKVLNVWFIGPFYADQDILKATSAQPLSAAKRANEAHHYHYLISKFYLLYKRKLFHFKPIFRLGLTWERVEKLGAFSIYIWRGRTKEVDFGTCKLAR